MYSYFKYHIHSVFEFNSNWPFLQAIKVSTIAHFFKTNLIQSVMYWCPWVAVLWYRVRAQRWTNSPLLLPTVGQTEWEYTAGMWTEYLSNISANANVRTAHCSVYLCWRASYLALLQWAKMVIHSGFCCCSSWVQKTNRPSRTSRWRHRLKDWSVAAAVHEVGKY